MIFNSLEQRQNTVQDQIVVVEDTSIEVWLTRQVLRPQIFKIGVESVLLSLVTLALVSLYEHSWFVDYCLLILKV